MITPSFALTATERVLPSMALDFTTASLDSRVTFTRSGNTATVTNSSGVITAINANLPRFDYNPTTLVCNGLLIEESRTNLKIYSQDLSNALAWSATFLTTLASGFTSPDNTSNGVKATNTAGITSLLQANIAITPSATNVYYPTIFVKKGNVSTVTLNVYYATGTEYNVFFNLDTLAVTNAPVANAFIFENYGNGWYRIGYQVPADATGLQNQMNYRIWESSRGAGVVGNFQYYFGAQLEIGSFATSYIPTVASQVTRTADVATMTGTNFSDWFNASQGTFVAYTAIPAFSQTTVRVSNQIFACDGTTDNFIKTRCFSTGTGNLNWNAVGATLTVTQFDTTARTFSSINTTVKNAIAYKVNDVANSVNAQTVVIDNTVTLPTMNTLFIGSAIGTLEFGAQHIQKIFYYPQRLINAEVQSFSK